MVTLYQAIKNIFNDVWLYNREQLITRKELISKLKDGYQFSSDILSNDSYQKYSLATMDNIRNMLEKLGYIDKVYYKDYCNNYKIRYGIFSINNPISDKLSYNQLRKLYCALNDEIKQITKKTGNYPNITTIDKIKRKLRSTFENDENDIFNSERFQKLKRNIEAISKTK